MGINNNNTTIDDDHRVEDIHKDKDNIESHEDEEDANNQGIKIKVVENGVNE